MPTILMAQPATGQAAVPTSFGWSPSQIDARPFNRAFPKSFPGSCSSRSGGIAASKASTSATATGSTTGTAAKIGTVETKTRLSPSALDHAGEPCGAKGRPALRREHEG